MAKKKEKTLKSLREELALSTSPTARVAIAEQIEVLDAKEKRKKNEELSKKIGVQNAKKKQEGE